MAVAIDESSLCVCVCVCAAGEHLVNSFYVYGEIWYFSSGARFFQIIHKRSTILPVVENAARKGFQTNFSVYVSRETVQKRLFASRLASQLDIIQSCSWNNLPEIVKEGLEGLTAGNYRNNI